VRYFVYLKVKLVLFPKHGIHWPCAVDVPALELLARGGGGGGSNVNVAFSNALIVNPAIPV
jgi:hypothetical protein